jgi:hypothetical protein
MFVPGGAIMTTTGMVTVEYDGFRYSARYDCLVGELRVSTGMSVVTVDWPAGSDCKRLAEQVLLEQVQSNPSIVGVPLASGRLPPV